MQQTSQKHMFSIPAIIFIQVHTKTRHNTRIFIASGHISVHYRYTLEHRWLEKKVITPSCAFFLGYVTSSASLSQDWLNTCKRPSWPINVYCKYNSPRMTTRAFSHSIIKNRYLSKNYKLYNVKKTMPCSQIISSF